MTITIESLALLHIAALLIWILIVNWWYDRKEKREWAKRRKAAGLDK